MSLLLSAGVDRQQKVRNAVDVEDSVSSTDPQHRDQMGASKKAKRNEMGEA